VAVLVVRFEDFEADHTLAGLRIGGLAGVESSSVPNSPRCRNLTFGHSRARERGGVLDVARKPARRDRDTNRSRASDRAPARHAAEPEGGLHNVTRDARTSISIRSGASQPGHAADAIG